MEDIKVSIIVPSYKRTVDMVSRAISSLLAQTYQNIEIVLVDDNAKPEHKEYREALAGYVAELNNPKVVYVQNEQNLGGAGARNVGIEHASGEYITFLDDDDRYLKNKIKNQLEFMLEHDLEMSFTNVVIVDGEDKVVDYREHSQLKGWDNDTLLRYHLTRQITATNTFMYQKQALIKIGCFVKVPVGQEYYLMFNSITGGLKIGYLDDDSTILYREGQECISNGANKVKGEMEVYAFKKQSFDKLSLGERMYVRFRHNAVLVVVHLRQKKIFRAMGRAMWAFCCSPIDFFKYVFGFGKKGKEVKIEE